MTELSVIYAMLCCLLSYLVIRAEEDPFSKLESTIISHGGEILRVTDPLYKKAATLWNPAIQVWPSVILRPAIYADVSLALSTLYSSNIPIRMMGGRHSYAGYCSHDGVVLDSALLKGKTINWADETITMQAGVIWEEVYNALNGSEYIVVGFTLSIQRRWRRQFRICFKMTEKIHRIRGTDLPPGQISFLNITWENEDLKSALLNWLIFLEEVANSDTRIAFDVIVYVSNERRFFMAWGTFNGRQAELRSVFDPWLNKCGSLALKSDCYVYF